jgi:hypothetical protein
LLSLAILLAVSPTFAAAAPTNPQHQDTAGVEFFETSVRPLLVEHCYECHGDRTRSPKGGLWLDSRDGVLKGGESGKPALVPGNVGASRLIAAVRRDDPDLQMPPKRALDERQIAVLEAWVTMGAPDPRTAVPTVSPADKPSGRAFWTFQRPTAPPVPAVPHAKWTRTPVDNFVVATLADKNLQPSEEADRRTLIRRATFDLTGLPPTPEAVAAFVADPAPDAYDRLVEQLLASPHYGERWGRYWLDLARYSDTKGYVYRGEERRFVQAANYRDWVVRALNDDMPYDRFLLLQIAADQLTPADGARVPQDLAAMGFLTVGRRFLGVVPDIVDDRMDVVMRSTMGLTVSCARCHDHKFDPIPITDYYSLYGVFVGSTEKTVCLEPSPKETPQYQAFLAGHRERIKKLDDTVRSKTDELVARLRVKSGEYLAEVPNASKLPDDVFVMILGVDDLNPAVVRQWHQYLSDRGRRFDPVWEPWTALAALPSDEFAAKAPGMIRDLVLDEKRPLNRRVAKALGGTTINSMTDAARAYGALLTEVNVKWLAAVKEAAAKGTGAPTSLPDGDEEALRLALYGADSPAHVPAGSVKDIEWFFDEPTRVQFGTMQAEVDRWILTAPGAPPHGVALVDRPDQRNPRVFKRGNPSTRGEEVSRHFLSLIAGDQPPAFPHGSGRLEMARAIASQDNPLTARVMVNRIWAQHFGSGIVRTPSDFGTRSELPTHPELLDWLAVRFVKDGWSIKAMHRLIMRSATYRQSSASNAAGVAADPENRLLWRMNASRLDFEALRDGLLAASGELDLTTGGAAGDVNGVRRTIYATIDRQFLPNVFRAFDFANPDLHMPQRAATTVPQQALFLMNAPFATARARALAARADVRGAPDDADRIRRMYQLVYQRPPTERQLSEGLAFIATAGNSTREPDEPPVRPSIAAWKYGFGSHDSTTDRVAGFTPLPHFAGTAWQGGPNWPDPVLGWVQLTSAGGHAGNDLAHAAIRRWIAPRDLTVRIDGEARHDYAAGNGIAARLVSSRAGTLGRWVLHNGKAETTFDRVQLKKGDALDFVLDNNGDLNTDMFTWAPTITSLDADVPPGQAGRWSAAEDFADDGSSRPPPLGPWEMYAHVLLSSNEFAFVD